MSALPSPAAELARLLSEKAEAVCRHYLSNGRRCGHYWTVGDVGNTPGRSLYVRLRGPSSGKGAAASGATPPRASTAISSTSSVSTAGSKSCAGPWTRPARF